MGVCAACGGRSATLVALDRSGVPHDAAGHRFTLEWTTLEACPGCDRGRLVHFSHDCFAPPSEEPWDMSWEYPVDVDDVRRLRAGLAGCPAPRRPTCDCPAHRSLRRTWEATWVRGGQPVHVTLTGTDVPEFHA